ncbi:hypothetical protein N7548_01400 [Acholeplasma manati]|uniref:Uncharacterized protein n=1 Tax=Paracholeplasma manati TaxID=591373 RepID=A0ABT2YBG2_9MOLU|nr:hypothetical protein [Paracholeplasma manati]MCV2231483.1 hypothetical protein [Paracholeplasma manati]
MNKKYELQKKEYLDNYEDVLRENEEYFKGKDENTVKGLKELLKQALDVALDVRKFEIEMYWKRATYFWVFISVTYAAYFSILSDENLSKMPILAVIVSFVGIVFSLAWYLVNRGSKYWQNNWEHHVDMLENMNIGPLYKLTIDNNNKPLQLLKAFPLSVSRINITVSLYITLTWFFLAYFSINLYLKRSPDFSEHTYLIIGLVTTLFFIALLVFNMESTNKVDESNLKRRD